MSNQENSAGMAVQTAPERPTDCPALDDARDWGYEAAMPFLTEAAQGDGDEAATWAPRSWS